MLTPRAILADIASPRVKKVVVDSDTYNEMDDQYAVAYAIGSPRMEVLALHAAPFRNARSTDRRRRPLLCRGTIPGS